MTQQVEKKSTRKAVVLLSGGLDSMLAAKMILDQGVHVEAINFYTGFCVEGHTHAIRNQKGDKVRRNNALWCAEQLGIKLHIIDVIEEYKDVVINPKHGYGANLNCTDCKGFMIGKALQWMEQHDFDFIVTGEVKGQRPMSQTGSKMRLVAETSGADDRLLRPLCARLFEPTLPERERWVDRAKLGAISGRGRKTQIALSKQWGITDFAQPAGGCCFLTDKSYSSKLADLWRVQGEKRYELDDIMMLKVGRHIRPSDDFKLIVCRDNGENNFAKGYRNRYDHLYCSSHPGPLALIDGEINSDSQRELAARIVARFGKGRDAEHVEMTLVSCSGKKQSLTVRPMLAAHIPSAWYV